jgi:OmpA-OmpF porin, OOP family
MKCNWWRWLWGIIPLLVLGWVAVEAEHRRLERDLGERARAALVQNGLGWAAAAFQGRDGRLEGRALDASDPEKAAEILRRIWGVRVVENRADLIEKAERYVWSASRRANRIRLSGYAPNPGARQAILGVAKASFPGFEVVDRMTLARGVPAADAWLGGVSFSLKQLASLKRGDARLEGLVLTVSGEAEDAAGYRAVKSALAGGLPKGIKLQTDNVTAPVVSPHGWGARLADGRLTLMGHVPSDAARAELVAAAKTRLPDTAIVDRMEPGEGAASGWAVAAAASIRELPRLESGQAEIKDGVLTLSGTASDEASAEGIRSALKAALPATIKFTDNLRIKPPPAPPPPKPAETVPPPPTPEAGSPSGADTGAGAQRKTELVAPAPAPPPAAAAPAPSAPVTPPPTPPPPSRTPEVATPARAAAPPTPAQVQAAKACQDTLTSVARSGTILFRFASAQLTASSFDTLNKLADAAKACPDMTIEIGGYASAEGDAASNQRLSYNRARSVLAYLVKAGVDAGQLQPVGYGIARPVAPNDSDENMAKNRRIEFIVRPK